MTKKGSNSIQKLLMTKREVYRNDEIIFTIAGLSLILSSKIGLFATVVKSFQMEIIIKKISALEFGSNPDPPLITIFGKRISTWRKQLSFISINCSLWK